MGKKIEIIEKSSLSCDEHPKGGAACKGEVSGYWWLEVHPVLIDDPEAEKPEGDDEWEAPQIPLLDENKEEVFRPMVFKGYVCAEFRAKHVNSHRNLSAMPVAEKTENPYNPWTEGKIPVRMDALAYSPKKGTAATPKKKGDSHSSAARARSARIREWAAGEGADILKRKGLALNDRGRIPTEINDLYITVTGDEEGA